MPSRQPFRSNCTESSGKLASILLTAIAAALALGSASTVIAAGPVTASSLDHPLTNLRGNAQDDARTQDTDGDGVIDRDEVQRYGTNPARPDSDRDGLTDGEEITIYGTNPLVADTDGDGLTDGDEIRLGTDPLDADTDGDGLVDGDEIALGSDPFNPDSDGDGLTDGIEVHELGTSPIHVDSDGDGLTDGDEVTIYNTNPAKPDAYLIFFTAQSGHKTQVPATAGASITSQPLRVAGTAEPSTGARIPLATTPSAPVVLSLDHNRSN